MKVAISLLHVFCFLTAVTQQKNTAVTQQHYTADDTLHWSKDRKLTWDDFKGVPDSTSTGAAGTVSGFVTKSRYTSDTTVSVIITAVFYKQKSWVKDQYRDTETLNHEHRHFDITEVYARKATTAFKKYNYNKVTVNNDIDSIVSFYFNEMNKMQDLYDRQTTKPINNRKQKEWDKKIAKWLQSGYNN